MLVLGSEALASVAALGTIVYVSRALGPELFGRFSLAFIVVTFLEWTVAAVFTRAAVRMISAGPAAAVPSVLFWSQLALALGFAVAQWASASAVATVLGDGLLAPLLRLWAFEIPLMSAAQLLRSYHVGRQHYGRRAAAACARAVARLGLTILLVHWGLGVHGAIIASILSAIAELLVTTPGVSFRGGGRAREMWRLAAPTFVFSMSTRAVERADLFLLKALGASPAIAGAYAAAQTIPRVALIVAASVTPLLLATLTRCIITGRHDLASRIARRVTWGLVALLPVAGAASFVSDDLIVAIFGAQYRDAAVPASILVLAAWALLTLYATNAILTAYDRLRAPAAAALAGAVVALSAQWVAIPRFGASGAAWVTALALSASAALGILLALEAGKPRPAPPS